MIEDSATGYEEMSTEWDTVYKCLHKYPELFQESQIGLNKFKWIYILTTNRCFSSSWQGVCQMMPFADYVNHENVDTGFDAVDESGISYSDHVWEDE